MFWDYSKIPFNLGGRINLLYCFFWGIAAVVWMKVLYPRFSGWIEKIPKKFGTWMTWILLVFMIFDICLSGSGPEPLYGAADTVRALRPAADGWLDTHFPDERMERIYPNAILVE